MKPPSAVSRRSIRFVLGMFAASGACAQTASIEGRVLNAASGSYLENARVSVSGTALETLTDASGEFRLGQIPPGDVAVTVAYSGFARQSRSVAVAAGATVRLEFALEPPRAGETDPAGAVVRLAEFSVSERRLSGLALALNEERVAPNIKNVIAFDEFGDMGESNPGEYLKYVPGLSITYGPNIPQFAAIRGMPAEGTLVTIDGGAVATSAGDRAFEFTGAATNNIDRIEVTKSPTPDQPANAIGGAINIVGKSGFSRKKPQLSYSVYGTFNLVDGRPGLRPSFSRRPGPDPRTDERPVGPGFDLTWLGPVSTTVAVTLSAGAGSRYNYYDSVNTLWNLVTNVDERLIKQDVIVLSDRKLAGAAVDWRVTPRDTLRASMQLSREHFRVSLSAMDYRFGAGATGDAFFVQSRPGTGIVANTASAYNSDNATATLGLRYAHQGPVWQYDADLSYSRGERETYDTKAGTFSGFTAMYTGLTMRSEGRDRVYGGALPRITATNAAGQAVNVHDGGGMPLTAAAAAVGLENDDSIRSGRINVGREFDLRVPVKFKTGVAVRQERLDTGRTSFPWTFAAPAGATPRSLGLVSDTFSARTEWYDYLGARVPVQWISPAKLYDYFQRHPQQFTLTEATAYTTEINNSKHLEETISAAYVSVEARGFNRRLRFVTGVRYERTADRGQGPLNDIGATYVHDAAGNIVRNAAGTPLRVTTNALELARLQFTQRGSRSDRTYDGFFPSLNASWQLRDRLVLRFAAAQTIGRPPIREITPGIVLPNPTTTVRTITANNTGLRPWTSDSVDFTLEAYETRGATITAGVFAKDIRRFFVPSTTPATAEFLAEHGLGADYLGYDVVTKRNGGSARLTGAEFSWRQALTMLPGWTRGLHAFVTGTFLSLDGDNEDDFTGFSPQNVNWGLSFARDRFLAKVNVARAGRVRSLKIAASASVPADAYRYIAPQTTVDTSVEYRLHRRLALYASARNATQSSKFTDDYAASTPAFARTRVSQRFGAMFTLGVKGDY